MLLLLPMHNLAGTTLLLFQVGNDVSKPAHVDTELQKHRRLQVTNAENSSDRVDGFGATTHALLDHSVHSTGRPDQHRQGHHPHKHPCCDGTLPTYSLSDTFAFSNFSGKPRPAAVHRPASIFLDEPERPPRFLLPDFHRIFS